MTSQTPTRFAIIDHNSGFVWGVTTASSPIAACSKIDFEVDPSAAATRTYVERGPHARVDGATAYHVMVVPAGFDVIDGQDAAEIAAVEAFPCVALVIVTEGA